jgi:FdhD protein
MGRHAHTGFLPSRGTARPLAEEVPIAITCNGTTLAVMMASPSDLEEFATGFVLTEGVVSALLEIEELEVVDHGDGIEARLWLAAATAERLGRRRRAQAGPVGCGLCGIDSIAEAVRPAARVESRALRLAGADPAIAMQALRGAQPLHDATRATHAAAFWRPGKGLVALREDVGRHNALDKLAGWAARAGEAGAGAAIVLTSRVSVEMVQKAAAMGAEAILAASAPTALALRMADAAGLTLVAGLKHGPAPALTHPDRLETKEFAS